METEIKFSSRRKTKSASRNPCLRRAVVIYNAFFWVTGPGMIGLGIWQLIALRSYGPVVDAKDLSLPAYAVIVAGGTSVVAGLIGCLGGVNEKRNLMVAYSLLIVIICTGEVAAGVFCFLSYDEAEITIEKMLNTSVQDATDKDTMDVLDSIQKEFSCCGVAGFGDWATSAWMTSLLETTLDGGRQVAPVSCCMPRTNMAANTAVHNDTLCNMHPDLLYQTGCIHALVSWLRQIYVIAGWTSSGVAATMVLALSAVCCFKHALSTLYAS